MAVLNLDKKYILFLTLSFMIPGIDCWSFWEKLTNAYNATTKWVEDAYNKVYAFVEDTINEVVKFAESAYKYAKEKYFELADYVSDTWDAYMGWIYEYFWGVDKIKDYNIVRDLYSLLEPWQLPRHTKFPDLQNITNCHCPRVFMPVCGVDNVTYVNACIMNCWKIKQRREGPCIIYRRSDGELINVAFPQNWKNKTLLTDNLI